MAASIVDHGQRWLDSNVMARKRKQEPVSPWRPGDMPEPINEPKLIREFYLASGDEVRNMLIAAEILHLDITVDSHKAEVGEVGGEVLQSAYHVRVWDEQRWSASMLPRPKDP